MHPFDLGMNQYQESDLFGGKTIEDAAKIFMNVLENNGTDAQRDAVLANSGLAIATGKRISFEEGIAQANESMKSGKALQSFKKFIELNGK